MDAVPSAEQSGAPAQASRTQALESRVVELETRLAFQEQALGELSDALAALRADTERNARLLRHALDELKQHRGGWIADPADEPPPPHY